MHHPSLSLRKYTLVELAFAIVADARGIFVHFWAEIAQKYEWLGVTGVLEGDPRLGAGFSAEVLVLGQLMKPNKLGAV